MEHPTVGKVQRVTKKGPGHTYCSCGCEGEILQGESMILAEVKDEEGEWDVSCFVNADHLVRRILREEDDSWDDLIKDFEDVPAEERRTPEDPENGSS